MSVSSDVKLSEQLQKLEGCGIAAAGMWLIEHASEVFEALRVVEIIREKGGANV